MTETMARPQLRDRYTATSGRVQLTGVQALARLPIDQHRRDLEAGWCVGTFISGYQGSPLAGYDTELGRLKQLLDANDVTFVPGLNEEAAATAIQGSQLACTLPGATRDGVLGIWYGKAPGLDRASDALRHGNLIGSHPRGGALVLVGDDPAAKSSTLPCTSDAALADLAIPYLYPADSQDVLDLGRHAIVLSRASGLWAGLKIVTAVADGSSTVDLAADRPALRIPPGAGTHAPTARLLHPTLGQLERDLVTNRLRLARQYARLNELNGDGTFDHSGSLAIRAAVAAGANMTYKLLYNSAVAMTGGQRPASGMTVPQIVGVLLAEGVARVIVTTEDLGRYRRVKLPRGVAVWDRSRIAEAQRVLAATPGVTVLVHDQECATEKRRKRKRGRLAQPQTRVFINERICEGCGDCGRKSNCLSVQPVPTEFGRKTRVHQSSCNVDYSCLDGDCPAFMTVVPAAGRKADAGAAAIGPEELPAPRPVGPADSFGIRLTGVGGTGVVTVSQVLATAGLIAGWHARSLDQTGLAQKGGAVVSDVRFSRSGPPPTNRLGAGECDLYLGCDLLVAADPKNLAVTAADRTVAVVSVAEVPTGPMVSDPALSFPGRAATSHPILDRVRDGSVLLDAREIVLGLFGDDQFANVFLVGAGFQAGAPPLPPDAIEEAIRVNGVAVEKNLQAFRRGRQYVTDPEAVLRAAGLASPGAPEAGQDALGRLIRIRSDDLTAYQDDAYARRYLEVVERVRAAERDKTPGSTALTEAVARYLYKLMAYKDEYEVARLSLEPSLAASLQAEFGPGARASWRLHPPVLRALGMKRKIELGPWFVPAFCVLRAMRRLRGTPMDPFGRTRVRVVERELIEEYLGLVDHLIGRLSPATATLAVRLAELPDGVRGYEDTKMRNVESYHQAMAELRRQIDEIAAGPQ